MLSLCNSRIPDLVIVIEKCQNDVSEASCVCTDGYLGGVVHRHDNTTSYCTVTSMESYAKVAAKNVPPYEQQVRSSTL